MARAASLIRLPVVALAATLVAEAVLLLPPPFTLTDHLVVWSAGRAVLDGASPYDPAVWRDAAARFDSPHLRELTAAGGSGVWPYPPWTALLFVPFAALPVELGTWALHLAYLASGLGAAIAMARALPYRSEASVAGALALFALFQPFVIAARWGQFSSFVLVGCVLVLVGVRDARAAPVVAGALLLSTKPQVGVVLGLVVALLLVRRRAWPSLGASAAALLSVAVVTWWRYPEWLGASLGGAVGRLGVIDRFASTWAFAAEVMPQAAGAAGLVLASLLLGCCVAAWRWSPASLRLPVALSAGAVASVGLAPYVLSYDHLLLAPAAFVALLASSAAPAAARALQGVAVLAVVAVVPWLGYLAGIFRPTQSLSGAVPLLFALLLLASAALLRARAPRAP